MRAESLQRRTPASFKALVAARTIAGIAKKNFAHAACDDPRAPSPAAMMHVHPAAAVLDAGRFVASASSVPSPIAATVAGFSTATTAAPSPGTPRCSSAPSDVLAETSFRIPSTDTPGFAAAAVSCRTCYPEVDSVDELLDLDRGSWEGSLPDSSSLGGDRTPLRGAFIIDSASLTGIQELTAEKTLSILWEWRHSHRCRLAAAWPSMVRQIGPVLRCRRHVTREQAVAALEIAREALEESAHSSR